MAAMVGRNAEVFVVDHLPMAAKLGRAPYLMCDLNVDLRDWGVPPAAGE